LDATKILGVKLIDTKFAPGWNPLLSALGPAADPQ
jgi:hypothetical protein